MPEPRSCEIPRAAEPQARDPRIAEPPAELLGELWKRLAELREYAGHLAAVRLDQVKLALRKALVLAVLALLGAIAVITMTITAVLYVLAGAAQGIGDLAWDQLWVGYLVVGVLVLGMIGGGVALGVARLRTAGRRLAARKYDERKRQQRDRFGHDVEQVARAARRPATPAGGR